MLYEVDDLDRVRILEDLPRIDCVGTPWFSDLAETDNLRMAYSTESVGIVAIVQFYGASAFYFGPPNDEAIAGHPLHSRGIHAYDRFEVLDSSLLRLLERRNRVHPLHEPGRMERFRHFIFTFHECIFECVASAYRCSTRRLLVDDNPRDVFWQG